MENIYNFNFIFLNHFLKKKEEFILSMWKLTLGYGTKGKGLGAGHSGPNLSSIPPKTKPNKVPYRTPKLYMHFLKQASAHDDALKCIFISVIWPGG